MGLVKVGSSAAWLSGKLLPTDQTDPGSTSGPAVGFFSSLELLYGLYGRNVYLFQCPFSMFCPLLLQRRPLHSPHYWSGEAFLLLYVVHTNFQNQTLRSILLNIMFHEPMGRFQL